MAQLRIAVVGLGRVGRHCCAAIAASHDLHLASLVRREESVGKHLPAELSGVTEVTHTGEVSGVDAALICLPSAYATEAAKTLLRHRVPVVEAAILSGEAAATHRQAINSSARRSHTAAIMGAGWNPGVLAHFVGLFTLLCPRGESKLHDRPGISLHHTLAAKAAPGVADALCAEFRSGTGQVQRYVYVELQPGKTLEAAEPALRADPLFADEETIVLPVPSVAALEDAGHGIVMERRGIAADVAHQRFILEGRFDRHAVTAQIMTEAARALPTLQPGGHALADLPLSRLWRDTEHLLMC
jgi:diaminopimelate dehydrogenase